jgi:hypothetical protein
MLKKRIIKLESDEIIGVNLCAIGVRAFRDVPKGSAIGRPPLRVVTGKETRDQ